MTILLTGGAKTQTGVEMKWRRLQIGKIPTLIFDQLQELDDVVRRPVEVGESLEAFDAIWVCMTPLTSLKCQYGPGMMWALYEAWSKKIPLVVYFDDWQVLQVFNGFRTFSRTPMKVATKVVGGSYLYLSDIAATEREADKLVDLCDAFEDRSSSFWEHATVAYPKYRHWGDTAIMERWMKLAPGSLLGYDPSYLMRDDLANATYHEGERLRRWMFATLVPHNHGIKSLKLTWPIDWYGPKKFHAPVLKSEQAVLEKNSEYWGSLAREYMQDGAAWWRRRYAFAAAAGTVLFTASKDVQEQLGPAYQYGIRQIEDASDYDLRRMAMEQNDRFMRGFDTSYDMSMIEIKTIIDTAKKKEGALV